MVSALDQARRALVTLVRTLAAAYGVTIASLSRNSPDKDLRAAYRKVSRKTHPRQKRISLLPAVAKAKFNDFKSVCKEVYDKRGAASRR